MLSSLAQHQFALILLPGFIALMKSDHDHHVACDSLPVEDSQQTKRLCEVSSSTKIKAASQWKDADGNLYSGHINWEGMIIS
jgi:hypothetical protein